MQDFQPESASWRDDSISLTLRVQSAEHEVALHVQAVGLEYDPSWTEITVTYWCSENERMQEVWNGYGPLPITVDALLERGGMTTVPNSVVSPVSGALDFLRKYKGEVSAPSDSETTREISVRRSSFEVWPPTRHCSQ
jgi:hypothetical protein